MGGFGGRKEREGRGKGPNLTSSTDDGLLHRFQAVDSTIEAAFDEIDL